MVGAVGASHMAGAEAAGQGKRAQSVAHQAKAAVAAAREGGAELPKNAQGLAASAVARGADPAALFASLVAPEEPPTDAVEGAAEAGSGAVTDGGAAPGTEEAATQEPESAGGGEAFSLPHEPGEIALELLEDGGTDTA